MFLTTDGRYMTTHPDSYGKLPKTRALAESTVLDDIVQPAGPLDVKHSQRRFVGRKEAMDGAFLYGGSEDPDWLAYVKKSGELGALEKQENILMNNVSFWSPNK